jgi:hypothetical protein
MVKPLEFMLHVAPNVERQADEGPMSTENATIVQRIRHPMKSDGDVSVGDVLPALTDDATPEMRKVDTELRKRMKALDEREARMEKQERQFRAMEAKFKEMQASASAAGTMPNQGGCCTVS